MAGTPLESSSTPPGPASPESTRSRRDSMGNTDSESIRKRPRLDSGSESREAMSTDDSSATAVSYDHDTASARSPRPTTSEPSTSQRPPSKVTINVKSPARPGNSTDPVTALSQTSSSSVPKSSLSDYDPALATTIADDATMAGAESSTAISISSSPLQSPEIEVAEVEDMDQDPSTSHWRPLGEALRHQSAPEVVQLQDTLSLTEAFPKVRGNRDLRDSVEEITNIIEKGHSHDVTAFLAVKTWLDTCVQNLSQLDYEEMVEEREFWEELPTIVEGLLRRVNNFQPNEGQGTWRCFEEFFLNFAALALRLVRLDAECLAQAANQTDCPAPDLLSKTYIPSLGWILQISNIPFFRAMERMYHAEIVNLVARVNDHVAAQPLNAVQHLSNLIARLFPLLARWSHLGGVLVSAMTVANNILESISDRKKHGVDEELVNNPDHPNTIRTIYALFRVVDEKYQVHVSKKFSWVTSDVSEQMLRFLGNAYRAFGSLDNDALMQTASDLSIQLPETATKAEEKLQIIYYGWKFAELKRHIMEGRMELRVFGMETMQLDLVHNWRQYIMGNSSGVEYPIIQYLVKFLRDNKIVEYIVGVDSHPQLISRSGNISGFLVVTHTYTNRDTDTIWKTVTESQDQRTVTEVLAMLTRTFMMHPATSDALIYLCSKLLVLPFSRFDTRMLDFCDQLFNYMREKHGERIRQDSLEDNYVDPVPLRLCVRLIRESATCGDFPVEHKAHIQKFASLQLRSFLSLGMSEADRMDMYERCIQDIAELNQFAPGSIQALNALLPDYDGREIRKLTSDFDLTRLLITDLTQAWNTDQSPVGDAFSKNAIVARIQMLNRIIDKVPDSITPELADTLWNEVFISDKADKQARGAIWEMLCRVTAHCIEENSFIRRCLHEYLPKLPPAKYGFDVLAFAEQAVSYEIRFNPPEVAVENEVITIPGMDRIWTFILTAPPGTIETKASRFAIDLYLDHALIRRAPPSAAEATHISLVNRCVAQIRSAAAKLKSFNEGHGSGDEEVMVIVAKDGEVDAEELRFSRSLLFLRQLLQGLRKRPQYSPPLNQAPELPERIGRGEPLAINYQSFNGASQSKVRSFQIGDLCTASELVDRLARLTGFSKFLVIHGGQKINLLGTPGATLRELKLQGGLLLIRKIADAPEASLAGRRQSLTLVDSEVLKHFDDLYDLLTLQAKLAQEIYDFLVTFPPQERVRELVKDESRSENEVFPLGKPYVSLFSLKALTTCLREESLETEPNEGFVSHSVRILVAALDRIGADTDLTGDTLAFTFACSLVDCLLLALSVRTQSAMPLDSPAPLIQQLSRFMMVDRTATVSPTAELGIRKLVCSSFAVLLEASIQDYNFWEIAKNEIQFEHLILTLLLKETQQSIRKEIAENITVVCGPSKTRKKSLRPEASEAEAKNPLEKPTTLDILAKLWEAFVQNMPKTLDYHEQSQEFLEVALSLFRAIAGRSPNDFIYGQYVTQWSEIMLRHKTEEFVGREPIDHVILGFARLLRVCLELAQQTSTPIHATELVEKLFDNYLFPELSEVSDGLITPKIPLMHNETREELYNILLLLCKELPNYERVIYLLDDLIPQDSTYAPNWSFERNKMIRSPEGYAGLKNLSNTCYLNSLFTQLFMNVGFRQFMLQLPIVDPESSQKLLTETKKMFGYMQDTWLKSVDPQGTVDSIRTYENEQIDVTIQMDVDEFYNLIFDRWEAQIMDTEDKKKFRSFYGGQLVQQIKSKECPHISERLEPFSAIQCEIKGKASLEESLQAYVEGEIMQGDNKYSCTSCGRHVDAVKRACLKDVPDNLIFHLKRFDFDMVTMMRSKINDQFEFPERIDIAPYKVEYLSDPNSSVEPDMFELVGVLVHSGTAESGHYYSYIKERPAAGSGRSWVEFNDSDVSTLDPSKIPDQCFGGLNDPIHSNTIGPGRLGKVWNAYMLFYQRVSDVEAAISKYKPSSKHFPVRVPLPVHLANHIAMENELFVRTYCLLDPYHAFFVRHVLSRSRELVKSDAPGASNLEKAAIFTTLDTIDQLISRTRDLIELDTAMGELYKVIDETPEGALNVLQWTMEREFGLRNLLLRSIHSPVRVNSARLFLGALSHLDELQENVGLDEEEREEWQRRYIEIFKAIVSNLESLWPVLPTFNRSWDEYFDFLCVLARFGTVETGIILHHGFLLKCLEIIWLDREDLKKLKKQYMAYYRLVERGRRFSYRKLTEFFVMLMGSVDLTILPTADDEPRALRNNKFSVTETEENFIRPVGSGAELLMLKKVLQQHNNPSACRILMETLLDAEPEAGMLDSICKALEDGLRVAPASHCVPFLEATLVFCAACSDEEQVVAMIDYVAKGIESINNSGGREHLTFLSSLLSVRNSKIGRDELWFTTQVVKRIPDYAPTLLIYEERFVRNATFEFLRQLLFSKENEDLPEASRLFLMRVGRELTEAAVDKLRRTYLVPTTQHVEAKVLETIIIVVNHCVEAYYDGNGEDADFAQQASSVLSALEELSVEVPEELASESDDGSSLEEWEDNSMMASDSDAGIAGTP